MDVIDMVMNVRTIATIHGGSSITNASAVHHGSPELAGWNVPGTIIVRHYRPFTPHHYHDD
jgi:hypothetical protein